MADQKKPVAAPPAEDKAKKVSDPELKAMHTIGRLLGDMDHAARHRVLHYIVAKYGKPLNLDTESNGNA